MKWLGLFILLLLIAIGSLPFLLLDETRLLATNQAVTAEDAQTAQHVTKQFHKGLSAKNGPFNVEVSADELYTVLKVASYSVPILDIESRLTSFGLTVVATIQLKAKGITRYVNVICIVSNGYQTAEIESCKVGAINIPGRLLRPIIDYSLKKFIGLHSSELWHHFLKNLSFESNKFMLTNLDRKLIKPAIHKSLSEANSLVSGSGAIDSRLVMEYLNVDSQQVYLSDTLLEPISVVFKRVYRQSGHLPEQLPKHVNAALWALIIRYGNPKFGRFVGIAEKIKRGEAKTLKWREDLALHFLYSAFLQLNSGAETAFSIGEIKELIDSNAGGTGFSFADLVADKAGLTFAEYITNPANDLPKVVLKLAQAQSESIFMLDIKQRPEGISEQEFVGQYKSINSPEYKKVIKQIGRQIQQLPLYR